MRVLALAANALLLAACGGASPSPPCAPPTGCVAADRVDGGCACTEWRTVSTETVEVPYVVTGVSYRPVGTASVFRYGVTSDPLAQPAASSRTGTNVRAVIRRADGGEQVARLGTLSSWAPLDALSVAEVRVAPDSGVWTFSTDVDLPAIGSDAIELWVNPAVSVRTDFIGEKVVDWSSSERCFAPGLSCTTAQVMSFPVSLVRGEATGSPAHEAFLEGLDARARDALLAFAPREKGGVAFPRYQAVALDVAIDAIARPVHAAWSPCPDLDEFETLAETVLPMPGGDALVLQYGVQRDAGCARQQPGLLVGTETPGCELSGYVFVDRLAGTLVVLPTAATPACTGG